MAFAIPDELQRYNEYYITQVKPLIERGEYALAWAEFGNMLFFIGRDALTIEKYVHMGAGYVVTARNLFKCLEKKENIEEAVSLFEAYAAQTRLPQNRELTRRLG